MLQLPRPQPLLMLHIAVTQRDLLALLDVAHSMDSLLSEIRVPAEARIRVTSVVEARGVRKHSCTGVHLHTVCLEDGYQRCRGASARGVLF